MARKGLNPNAPVSPDASTATKTEWASETDLARADAVRTEAAAAGAALDATMTQREADARREVPATRADSLNPRKDRAFRSEGAERPMLSSNMQKDLSVRKRTWENGLPKAHHSAMARTVSTREGLENTNRALRGVTGMRSELSPAVRRRVSQVDRAIQTYEAQNDRTHIVYATLQAPRPHGNSRAAMERRLRTMIDNPDNAGLTFDGYIPATHSAGNISDSGDLVMEIRTNSGAYLGTSDTTPDSSHLIGRGRRLRPVAMQEVTYVKPDGTRDTRTVVQMQDITDA